MNLKFIEFNLEFDEFHNCKWSVKHDLLSEEATFQEANKCTQLANLQIPD